MADALLKSVRTKATGDFAAGPEYLEDYSKSWTFGLKIGTKSLVHRYQIKFPKTVPKHLKVCHLWLIKDFLKTYV